MVKNLIDDFQRFIRNPEHAVLGAKFPPFHVFVLIMVAHILFAAVFTLPATYLIDRHILKLKFSPDFMEPSTLVMAVLTMVVFAPLLEETLFRYPLKFARGRVLKVGVYVSSVVFGLVHFINYSNREALFFLLIPVIFSSQLIGGLVLAYLRLKQGLRWSILAHVTFNALVLGGGILFIHGNVVLDESTDNHSLYVKEYAYLEKRPKQFTIHRTNEGIDTISVRQISLRTLLDSIGGNGRYVDNVIVDMDFKSTEPISSDSLINLLKKQYRIE